MKSKVVMVILDAFPHRMVGPSLTPNLWRQVRQGGRAPDGGLSLPVSVTYANHAALVTGAPPEESDIHGNAAWHNGGGWVPSPSVGPRLPTLFDRSAARDARSTLIAGDQKLVAQMGGADASHSWPPDGRLPDGTPTCEFGHASDDAVVKAAEWADLDAELVVIHLNEPDTTSHRFGPDSDEAREQYRRTDAAYGRLVEMVAAHRWNDTVMVTLSDHDQEPVVDDEPVDLAAALGTRGWSAAADETPDEICGDLVHHDGTAALIRARHLDVEAVRRIPGVESAAPLSTGFWMAWTEPGRCFGTTTVEARGQHGSPRCRTQVAVVSGGHDCVPALARRIERHRPSTTDWAPMIDGLLGGRP